jgi:hypothetical protein
MTFIYQADYKENFPGFQTRNQQHAQYKSAGFPARISNTLGICPLDIQQEAAILSV